MNRHCDKCGALYDDEFRFTFCPHDTFAANDGQNKFTHHPESPVIRQPRVRNWYPVRYLMAFWRNRIRGQKVFKFPPDFV